MTINKSQGQSLKAVGINLTSQCFTHGMLYAALSRVGMPSLVTILVKEDKKQEMLFTRRRSTKYAC